MWFLGFKTEGRRMVCAHSDPLSIGGRPSRESFFGLILHLKARLELVLFNQSTVH